MTADRMRDFTIFSGLTMVQVEGFKPKDDDMPPGIDAPGSANWLCQVYGMSAEELEGPGILWTDYDFPGWEFSVLIDSDEAEAFIKTATDNGYYVVKTKEVTEPDSYGDGMSGTVAILKHHDGWVVLKN